VAWFDVVLIVCFVLVGAGGCCGVFNLCWWGVVACLICAGGCCGVVGF